MTYNVEKCINKDDTNRWIDYWKDKADLLEVWTPHNWVNGRKYRTVQKRKKKPAVDRGKRLSKFKLTEL